MRIDIHSLIGEATAYDKKQQIEAKRPKSWLKSVSAFANGEGGTLVFGITDEDQVVGLENAEQDAELISEAIKTIWSAEGSKTTSFECVVINTCPLGERESGRR